VVIEIVNHLLEERIIRIRNSTNNRQHNGQKKKYKGTNNDLQNIHIKLKIEEPLKTGDELRCSERVSSSCSMLFVHQTINCI